MNKRKTPYKVGDDITFHFLGGVYRSKIKEIKDSVRGEKMYVITRERQTKPSYDGEIFHSDIRILHKSNSVK